MKKKYLFFLLLVCFVSCGSTTDSNDGLVDPENITIEITPADILFSAEVESKNLRVKSNVAWSVSSDQDWCTPAPVLGYVGETSVKISVTTNRQSVERSASLTFSSGSYTKKYTVKQSAGKEVSYVPEGYSLIWQDEFNQEPTNGVLPLPNNEWWFETGNNGWGNNEPQYYVDRVLAKDTVAKIKKGSLIITAIKLNTPYNGSDYISARMNTTKSWKYGYFEMSAKLAGGKGTWSAFWMMPQNFVSWPLDGEIDIMEYVGYDPNIVHSTIHTEAYNHVAGTEKNGTKQIVNAETDFHVYAVKWTENEIIGYVDGIQYFQFQNDQKGDKKTWPFNEPFYLKLNLAIGGNWGGLQGIDPTIFPARYEIDYVRVYQK